jgi:protein-lysine N-methyltransferase EEF2KMT
MPSPLAPTASLLPLAHLSTYTLAQINDALSNLRTLYFPPPKFAAPAALPSIPRSKRIFHLVHDDSVPDSGYASAEEVLSDDEDVDEIAVEGELEDEESDELELLRADTFERSFAIKWLTGFTARSDAFLDPSFPISDSEYEERAALLDTVASLLGAFISSEDEDEENADDGILRTFSFPLTSDSKNQAVEVHLNDAPLQKSDHTSVGLQSWASSIVLAERICARSALFGLTAGSGVRVLELGAGTGLLSIAVAKLFAHQKTQATVVATDFHPDVLANLERNVLDNFPSSKYDEPICIRSLDWSQAERDCATAPLSEPFDVILAADVVYEPAHANWLYDVVTRVLSPDGVFWMMLAQRASGRHEGLVDAVNDVFPSSSSVVGEKKLAVLEQEDIARVEVYGRADEGGYRMYKIGWV